MPLSSVYKINNDIRIGFWLMSESLDELLAMSQLSSSETNDYEKLHHEKVKKQWLSARLLAAFFYGAPVSVYYDAYGKPHCRAWGGISITHSGDYVLMAIHNTAAVGVDIEQLSRDIAKVKHKFTSLEESFLQPCMSVENEPFFYHLLWCFKEAVYKLHGRKNLIFKDHIILKEIKENDSGSLTGVLIADNELWEVKGHFVFFQGYVICICWYAKQ